MNLPKFNWFIQNGKALNNVYSACIGTDTNTGFMNKTIFEYRVFVKDDMLHACHLLRFPWNNSEKMSEITEKTFDATEQGLNEAALWLSDEFNNVNEN